MEGCYLRDPWLVLVGSLLLVGIVSSVGWGASLKLTGIVVGGHPELISVIV